MWLKCVLVPLGLTASASAADARIHKKILGSGNTTLIVSNDEIEDIIIIVKSLEDSGLFLEGVTESMLLGTLGASLLEIF